MKHCLAQWWKLAYGTAVCFSSKVTILRWVGFMRVKAQEEEMSLKEDLTCMVRKVTEAQRHRLLTIAKKFVEGMLCCRKYLPELNTAQFEAPFAKGEFDDVIWLTSKPGMTGRFWPWVKEACAAAEAAAAEKAEAELRKEAEAAGVAAEKAFLDAQQESESAAQQAQANSENMAQQARETKATATLSVLTKLREAHCKTVQLHCQGKGQQLQAIWSSAEEATIRRHERSETEGDSPGFLDLQGDKGKAFANIPWIRQLPSKPRVVVIDADLYSVKESQDGTLNPLQEDAQAALDLVGDKGCVIVVTSAPSFAASGRALAVEQGTNTIIMNGWEGSGSGQDGYCNHAGHGGWRVPEGLMHRPWWLVHQG